MNSCLSIRIELATSNGELTRAEIELASSMSCVAHAHLQTPKLHLQAFFVFRTTCKHQWCTIFNGYTYTGWNDMQNLPCSESQLNGLRNAICMSYPFTCGKHALTAKSVNPHSDLPLKLVIVVCVAKVRACM
jgi:hypothetical protein